MDDDPDAPAETTMQRALRLKKAALEGRQAASPALRPDKNKRQAPGASKPWMKR